MSRAFEHTELSQSAASLNRSAQHQEAPHICILRPSSEDLAVVTMSGLLRSTAGGVVVDSRGALGTESRRRIVLDELVRHVIELQPDVVAGIANSGTTWAVLIGHHLGLDFANVLVDGPRAKGLGRQVEPDGLVKNRTVLLVDNWIETGSSVAAAMSIVERSGGITVGALTVSCLPGASTAVPMHVAFPLADLLAARSIPSQCTTNHSESETK